ncbi:MAG: GntR family transcriptional regulator [Betaproteobacteria bacterium]
MLKSRSRQIIGDPGESPRPSRALNPGKSRPRYSEVADLLRLAIMTGRHPVGSLLPSESELCRQFSISRHTAREAIRVLQLRGLVSRHQGRGTEVLQAQQASRVAHVLGSLEEVERQGRDTRLVDLTSSWIAVDTTLAPLLNGRVGERFLKIQAYREPRDMSVNLPRAWTESFIREQYAGIQNELPTWQGAVYSLIEKLYGERVSSIRQEVSAINLPDAFAHRLSVKSGTAGLRVKRSYFNEAGVTMIIGINIYAGLQFSLIMDIRSHD